MAKECLLARDGVRSREESARGYRHEQRKMRETETPAKDQETRGTRQRGGCD